jgi:phage shock protein PspC (stress-responsive transcriptional regulator)
VRRHLAVSARSGIRRSGLRRGTVRRVEESTGLVRPRHGRIVAGVCAGLARRLGVRPWKVRLLFAVSCLLPGPQFLLYLALWILLRPSDRARRDPTRPSDAVSLAAPRQRP